MIKVTTPSFLFTSEETQTPTKVSELTIIYSNILTFVDELPVGIIQSYCMNEGNSILSDSQPNTDFTGDILYQLTEDYITKLTLLNPNTTFVNTLIV
jgi:hypothetical protein